MNDKEFQASAQQDVIDHCFCNQLSQIVLANGGVCHWCNQLRRILDGTIPNLTDRLEKIGLSPREAKAMSESESTVAVTSSEETESMGNGRIVQMGMDSRSKIIARLEADGSDGELLELLNQPAHIYKAGRGNAWRALVPTAQLETLVSIATDLSLNKLLARIEADSVGRRKHRK